MHVTKTIHINFNEFQEFKQEVFKAKSYFLAKEQSHGHFTNDLEYPEGLVSNPEYKNNLVNRTSSTPPLLIMTPKVALKTEMELLHLKTLELPL